MSLVMGLLDFHSTYKTLFTVYLKLYSFGLKLMSTPYQMI